MSKRRVETPGIQRRRKGWIVKLISYAGFLASNVNLFYIAQKVEDVVKFRFEVRRKIHGPFAQTPTGPRQSDLVLMQVYT